MAVQEDVVVCRPQACISSCRPGASPEASVPCFLSPAQVICKDWSNLAGKSYIILNMTENIDCVSAELAMRRGKGQREVPQQGSCWGGRLSPELSQHLPLTENQKEVFPT